MGGCWQFLGYDQRSERLRLDGGPYVGETKTVEHWKYLFLFEGLYDYERTSVEKGPMNQELKSSKNEGE